MDVAEELLDSVGEKDIYERIRELPSGEVRKKGLKYLVIGLVLSALGGVVAAAMPHLLRVPAAIVGGVGIIMAYLSLVAVVMGNRVAIVLKVLTGKITGQGCLICLALLGIPYLLFTAILTVIRLLQ